MDLPNAPDPLSTVLLDGRLPALLIGIVLLGWGAKVYPVLVVAPGVLVGVYLAAVVGELAHLTATVSVVMTVVFAAGGALLCHFVEGMAIRVGGAGLFAALSAFVWPLVRHGPVPFWVPLIAAIVGALIFPKVYQVLLRPTTALIGAWSIAWAVKRPDALWLVGGLAVAGTALQFWLDRGGSGGAPAPKKKEKGKKKG